MPKKVAINQAEKEMISETEQQGISVEEDEQNKSLTLQAPNEFVKDWIQQKYSALIEKSCTQLNYKHSFA